MTLTGGAIGMGLPLAVGAAVGSRSRVLALESDGSMMYTLQALWTMARERLDVTVVGLSNRSYAVSTTSLRRVGAVARVHEPADARHRRPDTRPLRAREAQGVPSVRVTTADELVEALRRSYATPGPTFIEADAAQRTSPRARTPRSPARGPTASRPFARRGPRNSRSLFGEQRLVDEEQVDAQSPSRGGTTPLR